jgi:hypothetical protein
MMVYDRGADTSFNIFPFYVWLSVFVGMLLFNSFVKSKNTKQSKQYW